MSQHSHPTRSEYDFIILGGGSAGYAAARTAAGLGLQTLVVEGGEEVGGLCILRGCMPSKTVIESANRMLTLRRAAEFGLRADNLRVEPGEILARKRRMVEEFASYRRGQLAGGRFEFVRGFGRFTDAHSLEILNADNRSLGTVRGKAFLLATGSVISRVDLPGLAEAGYLTSDDALELAEIPESLIVLGAGAIAMEAAHHLSGLGAKVTVINRGGQALREVDADIAHAVVEAMSARGVTFHLGTQVLGVERTPEGRKRVRFASASGEQTVEAAEILMALGRSPATERLGLEHVPGLVVERGRPQTGANQRTTAEHIYAAGDVCGPHEIVHLAIQQGEIAARNAARALGKLDGGEETMDYRAKMFCVFTHPQIGVVGLSEREARAAGLDFAVATYPFADHGKSIVMGETEGFVKLLADRRDNRLIGGAVVGPEASDLIHEVGMALHLRATARDFALAPHYHPTLSEIWTYPAEELAGM
ncbi:MAG: NAD(P)/FAD-dependent oxidoreductase [Verrucomicrobia bacterium]|nr:NAD(P)/FAD-dependent oxidoreductase [Verrucomicrobiota bacterium]